MYLKKPQWIEGITTPKPSSPESTSDSPATSVADLVNSLTTQRVYREVTLALRSGLRNLRAEFSFLRVRGLRSNLKFLRSVAESDSTINLFSQTQSIPDLQVFMSFLNVLFALIQCTLQSIRLGFRPSSLPVPIGSAPQFLSSTYMELSEDYTCIISYGPNPKTTHIFCDCVLECQTKELNNFDSETSELKSPRVGKHKEGLTYDPSDENLNFCYTCETNLKGEEIYMCRSEKAFCSFNCHLEKNFAEEEAENTSDKSAESSSESYPEDMLLLGMHCQETLDIE